MNVTKYLYFNIRFGLQETLLCLFLQKTKKNFVVNGKNRNLAYCAHLLGGEDRTDIL